MFKKTHMSLSVSRTWSAYEPVGDPYGGPAYGKKEFFNLISAGLSVYAGLSAGASLIGGLMIAGGILTGLGELSGNKKLSALGSVASLAGGVAGFFQEGGWSKIMEDGAKPENSWSSKIFGDGMISKSPTSVADTMVQSPAPVVDGSWKSAESIRQANDVSSMTDAQSMFKPSAAPMPGATPSVAPPSAAYTPPSYDFNNPKIPNTQMGSSGASGSSSDGLFGGLLSGLSNTDKLMLGQGAAGLAQGAMAYMKEPTDEEKAKLAADAASSTANAEFTQSKTAEQNQRLANRNLDPKLATMVPKVKPGSVLGGAYDYVALWRNATKPKAA